MRFSGSFAVLKFMLCILLLLCCCSLIEIPAIAQVEAEAPIESKQLAKPTNDSEQASTDSKKSLEDLPAASTQRSNANFSSDALASKAKAAEMLLENDFTYRPDLLNNPFVPFIKPPEPPPAEIPIDEEDEALPPELQRPLTPLQKMNIGEIERGLKAILWGELGRKAIIQDSAGKGYIVSVGTPAGGGNGVISQIFDDRLVIQQQVWDGKLKRLVPRNEVVKLRKAKTE